MTPEELQKAIEAALVEQALLIKEVALTLPPGDPLLARIVGVYESIPRPMPTNSSQLDPWLKEFLEVAEACRRKVC